MSGRESQLWQHVKRVLTKAATAPLYLRRVENPLNDGHPDVEYLYRGSAGVIELKQREAWPKRPTTKVRLQHYTKAQRDDLRERYMAGGRAFLLLQVAEEYLLVCMPKALLVGQVTREDLYRLAVRRWNGQIDGCELLEELTK